MGYQDVILQVPAVMFVRKEYIQLWVYSFLEVIYWDSQIAKKKLPNFKTRSSNSYIAQEGEEDTEKNENHDK